MSDRRARAIAPFRKEIDRMLALIGCSSGAKRGRRFLAGGGEIDHGE